MIYYDRRTDLKIGNLQIPEQLELKWDYEVKPDSSTASMTFTISNLSKVTQETIKKGDIVSFAFGYEEATSYFTGVVDKTTPQSNGTERALNVVCYEYKKEVTKRISRSYNPKEKSSYIIKDIAQQTGLNLVLLELGTDVIQKNGYNVYDLPLIALKKIVNSCGSDYSVQGNDLFVTTGEKGITRGVDFNYNSGLLKAPDSLQGSLLSDDEYSKAEKEKELKKVKTTHKIITLANPDVKKDSIIKVLEDYYKVVSFKIKNWEFEGECLKIG